MKLAFKQYGDPHSAGPKLILLHGLFASKENFHTLGRRLSGEYSVHVPDLRNHGESPWSDEMSYPLMAGDVADFIEREIGAPVVALGHSMGGKTAMELSLRCPEMLSGLIVEDIGPRRYEPSLQSELAALRDLPVQRLRSRKEAEEWMAGRIQNRAVALFLLKNLYSDGEGGFKMRLNIDALESHYPDILDFDPAGRQFAGPTLVIRGGASPFIRDEDEPVIRSIFQNVQIETFENVSHWVHAERPAEVQAAVLNFLTHN